jgi:hypothetical protein
MDCDVGRVRPSGFEGSRGIVSVGGVWRDLREGRRMDEK